MGYELRVRLMISTKERGSFSSEAPEPTTCLLEKVKSLGYSYVERRPFGDQVRFGATDASRA